MAYALLVLGALLISESLKYLRVGTKLTNTIISSGCSTLLTAFTIYLSG